MLRHVDLCSGIGGFALGFQWAELSVPVLFCDIEPYCRKILRQHWPDVRIEKDVKDLADDPTRLVPDCDILTAGYPCQPFSNAGQRKGEQDDRHIWPFISRIVAQKRPSWCVFENVYGHLTLGLDTVLADLEANGYSTRPFIVPACGVDAPHKRDRIWIVAHTTSDRGGRNTGEFSQADEQEKKERPQKRVCEPDPTSETRTATLGDTKRSGQQGNDRRWTAQESQGRCEDVADTPIIGLEKHGHGQPDDVVERGQAIPNTAIQRSQGQRESGQQGARPPAKKRIPQRRIKRPQPAVWPTEPDVGRVVNGLSGRVDRIKGLGNAIVPQIAMRIGQTIKAVHDA